ncbi:ImmA/IrrE family metallo-endopeptidase [Pseudofrankia sp. BMG5.36]|uniref:ImmA/IrrE family metallo-endopeptidase n=1 Tax=Pseudofrankia sp. BMG5.36 TaxID=1834512 RepID=UPI0008D9DF5D|nr:ImmA/IrrE family metallo-endopeptidase [Pseudofrankia sp. BMG5.36]OHV61412.1 hypothetical protein BCD48_39800 [Pseudofrankia sp. BMG5.36]
MAYRRGFKAEAERLALTTRQELGLGTYARFDPLRLAAHLGIPVQTLSDVAAGRQDPELDEAVGTLHGPELQAISAYTVLRGRRAQVVYNDGHTPGRIANSVTHELCHAYLLHQPTPALDGRGCRIWNEDQEDEADFQSGALLLPAKAAWWIAKQRQPFAEAAEEYGCSIELVRWRVNVTGAGRLLAS